MVQPIAPFLIDLQETIGGPSLNLPASILDQIDADLAAARETVRKMKAIIDRDSPDN